MVEIAVAVIGALGVVYAAKVSRDVRAVHDEVRTNNGKRAGEYIEMVPELGKLLAEHTIQDAENFSKIDARLYELDAKITANW